MTVKNLGRCLKTLGKEMDTDLLRKAVVQSSIVFLSSD